MSELSIVRREYAGSKVGMMFAWMGLGWTRNGPWKYHFSDGYVLQQHPLNTTVPGHYYIARGCSDVTGAKFEKYLRLIFDYEGKEWREGRSRGINALELDDGGNWGVDHEERFVAYDGPLYDDPDKWAEPWRSWYLDSHLAG